MLIFPAIDLVDGKAVRLYQGDYAQMTVYSDDPAAMAASFAEQGATCLHMVDLEGAKSGETPNLETVRAVAQQTSLFTEVGGGIRSMTVIDTYLNAGVDRVILGTAAVKAPGLVAEAVEKWEERIAVGVDIRDGFVAISGWTESSERDAFSFCEEMQALGVQTVICTDISRDGAMRGTNRQLYRELSARLSMHIVASGGVSTLEDVKALREMGLYAAIIGKACYTGAISLREAIEVAE